jgi:RNA polymerase sigma-70 factor (ECF subfamily)
VSTHARAPDDRAGGFAPGRPDDRGEADRRFERDALPWLEDVHRFASSLARGGADADDIVQETYLRAYRSWHTFRDGSDCRRWLFTICRNVFLRAHERDRHEVELEEAEVEALNGVRVHAQAMRDGTDRLLAQLDLGPALARALDQLPEPFRSAVVLVDLEDQSYETAAEILDVPIGTVRSRLFRGRRILQDQLITYARDAGFVQSSGVPAPTRATNER